MSKAKTAKILPAAVASIAAVSFAASPASASAHPAPGTAGGGAATAVPSAGRSHPGVTVLPPGRWRIVKLSPRQLRQASPAATAAAPAAKAPGFVPRHSAALMPGARKAGRPGRACAGLYDGGNYASCVNESWMTGTGCHIGDIAYATPGGASHACTSPGYIRRDKEYEVTSNKNFSSGTFSCGSFTNISGAEGDSIPV
jgi:hypothetical protein